MTFKEATAHLSLEKHPEIPMTMPTVIPSYLRYKPRYQDKLLHVNLSNLKWIRTSRYNTIYTYSTTSYNHVTKTLPPSDVYPHVHFADVSTDEIEDIDK